MATRYPKESTEQKRDRKSFTLVDLLNTDQPYNEFNRLPDSELGIDDNNKCLQKIQGSLVGLAVGDALGASVEFRPNAYLKQNPVNDMQAGGTWGLKAGQWTDDTSMTLCLAASLIVKGKFDGYDQFVRYRRWYRNGYMSSTGKCFDIGKSTRQAIVDFENKQRKVAQKLGTYSSDISGNALDQLIEDNISKINFTVECGLSDSAGNGSLMRLTPIPSFFFYSYDKAIQYSVEATKLTHGDERAIDACRFYAALIWHALDGLPKEKLLHENFYQEHGRFKPELHPDVLVIAKGSYKNRKGYEDGIRGKGFVLNALEAALWAFDNDKESFKEGVLLAVNLGDDTDTTAAIYGELAGAVYGIKGIPDHWCKQLFKKDFIMTVAKGLYVKGNQSNKERQSSDWSDPAEPNGHQEDTGKSSHHGQDTSANDPSHQDPETSGNNTLPRRSSINILPEQ